MRLTSWLRQRVLQWLALPPSETHRVEIGPYDVIWVQCHGAVSPEAAKRIQGHINTVYPNHTVFVTDSDMTIKVMSRDKVDCVAARVANASLYVE